uniref:Uncharacterized protein n=1 Tax=Candidatus Kentrum eta TaxID=2126337 RepID=A0A450UTZ7_9GAMM|nr:MAG: hypothetical protein BECKH772A_GA0070896_100967 [Candidatus Kentron sp. H]VFJ97623.1 MAG: hypothetical protein BECKH772B_GA0070898_101155 [Candidatus Kentron sp. H]VFK03177.1 MAG: hypothetical protein BECKH772C_GA0070978_101164 [Candidatus Kentron sp. H]
MIRKLVSLTLTACHFWLSVSFPISRPIRHYQLSMSPNLEQPGDGHRRGDNHDDGMGDPYPIQFPRRIIPS